MADVISFWFQWLLKVVLPIRIILKFLAGKERGNGLELDGERDFKTRSWPPQMMGNLRAVGIKHIHLHRWLRVLGLLAVRVL